MARHRADPRYTKGVVTGLSSAGWNDESPPKRLFGYAPHGG
jgi:hypothetical protein